MHTHPENASSRGDQGNEIRPVLQVSKPSETQREAFHPMGIRRGTRMDRETWTSREEKVCARWLDVIWLDVVVFARRSFAWSPGLMNEEG